MKKSFALASIASAAMLSFSSAVSAGSLNLDLSLGFLGKTFQIMDPHQSFRACVWAKDRTAIQGSCNPPQGTNLSNLTQENGFIYTSGQQIKTKAFNICLDAPVRAEGAAVKSATCNGSYGQKWKILSFGTAAQMRYNISTYDNNYCLSSIDGQGQNYSLRRCDDHNDQLFEFGYLNNPNEAKSMLLTNQRGLGSTAGYRFNYNENQADLMILNKTMKSYSIPEGWTVRFYEGKNFTGNYYTRTGSSGTDSWVYDKIQSFKILSKN